MAFSADGTAIASRSDDRTVRPWDVVTGSCKCTLTGDTPMPCVRCRDAEAGSCKCMLTVDSSVYSVAFSPDGSKIAAAYSNKIQILDAQAQAKLGSPLTGHTGPVNSVCFDHTG